MSDRMYYSRDAEVRASRERLTAILVFLALGVTVGGLLALLFAPQSGHKTRKELASSLEGGLGEGLENTMQTVHRLEKEFAELRKKVENRVGDLR